MTPAAPQPRTLQARIVSGSVVLLSGSSLTTGINLAYNVVVARFLGPSGYGQTTAVYTLLTLISAVTLAYQLVTAKVVARHSADEGAGADFGMLHRSAWIAGLSVAVGLLVFQHQIADYLKLPGTLLVVLLAIGGAFYIPLGSLRGLIQGVYGFRSLAMNLVLEGVCRLGGSFLMVKMGFGAAGVIGANAASMIVAYVALLPRRPKTAGQTMSFGAVHREIAHALVFFSGQMLINNCDIVLVKHFFTPTAAGLYAVVAMVGRVIFALCQAVVNSMVPIVAGTRAEERKGFSLISTALLLVLLIGSVLAVGLRFTPALVWTKLFGAGFLLLGPHGFPYLLALYAVTTVVYSLSAVIITYEMSYKIANMSLVQLLFSGLIVLGISRYHSSLQQVILVQLVLVSVLLFVVAVPFVRAGISESAKPGVASIPPVRLLRRVTEDEVIAEFLQSDFSKEDYGNYYEQLHSLIFQPNFEKREDAEKRKALFLLRHAALWKEIPLDTLWYEVELSARHLPRVRVFQRAQWRRIARGNYAITEVADRVFKQSQIKDDPFLQKMASIRERFTQSKSMLGSVVLIGVTESDPIAIIDGNHRFVAAVMEQQTQRLRYYCGLSPKMTQCCWYRTNLMTLTRYGKNLLRHAARGSNIELAALFERSG